MVVIVLSAFNVGLAALAIARRDWIWLAGSVFVFLPLTISAGLNAERARRDPTWKPWGQRQILARPLMTGVCGGIAFGLLMTLTMVSGNDGPIGLALLIALAVCVPLGVAFAYVGRNDLRRRLEQDQTRVSTDESTGAPRRGASPSG
jgi:hypothetical protein